MKSLDHRRGNLDKAPVGRGCRRGRHRCSKLARPQIIALPVCSQFAPVCCMLNPFPELAAGQIWRAGLTSTKSESTSTNQRRDLDGRRGNLDRRRGNGRGTSTAVEETATKNMASTTFTHLRQDHVCWLGDTIPPSRHMHAQLKARHSPHRAPGKSHVLVCLL